MHCRLWLQNRCGYLLQAQAALTQAADPSFSTWNQVYDHVMRSSTTSQPTMSLDIAASRSTATMDASASFVVQQLHSSVIVKGSETLLKGVSDVLDAAFEESAAAQDRSQSGGTPASGGSPSSSARQAGSTSGPCVKLRLSMLAVSSQVCLDALFNIGLPPQLRSTHRSQHSMCQPAVLDDVHMHGIIKMSKKYSTALAYSFGKSGSMLNVSWILAAVELC